MKPLHLSNATGRDTRVSMAGLRKPRRIPLGTAEGSVRFKRYLAATTEGMGEALEARYGEALAEKLITTDVEVDLEQVGRTIGETAVVYLSAQGDVLYAPPAVVEILLSPDGQEKERRTPVEVPPNVNDDVPVRWTGRKMPIEDVIRKFAFRRTVQLKHVDGLTYDFLFEMAKTLDDERVVLLLGAGPKGRKPLVFQANGAPYQGFLEGRVSGEKYKLLLHLSNLELKQPKAEEEA